MSDSQDNLHSPFTEKGLNLVKHCPICKHEYARSHAAVVDSTEDTELIHVTCASCHSSMHILVSGSSVGMSVLGMLTDLTREDSEKMISNQEVSEEDVLSLHYMLTHKVEKFWSFLGIQ